jgi:adenosylcobinamide kinase/adenosylcobinamide-phosphate guanylyltransferase
MSGALTLVLGGARSGKSRYAEDVVEGQGGRPIYLATADAGDDEMAARIVAHRVRRGSHWQTVEEPLDLIGALRRYAATDTAVLVDCLTLWLTNVMLAGRDATAECADLVAALPGLAGPVTLVSNEVGLGIVPAEPLGRDFRDCAGLLHQELAAVADRVVLVVAGLPQQLKPSSRLELP